MRVDLEGEGILQRGSFHRELDGTLRDCRALPAAGAGLHHGSSGPARVVDLLYIIGLGSRLVGLGHLGGLLLARRRARAGRDGRSARRWLSGVGLALATASLLAVPVVGWFAGGVRPGSVEAALLAIALIVPVAATRRRGERHGLANDLVAASRSARNDVGPAHRGS